MRLGERKPEASSPKLRERRRLDLAPRAHVIRTCFEIGNPPVKLRPLRLCWVRKPVSIGNAVPESLHQFKLLLHAELAGLVKKMSVHAKSIARFQVRRKLPEAAIFEYRAFCEVDFPLISPS